MLLLIKNGKVVNADKSIFADVLIEDNRIIEVSDKISKHADQVIDAQNCLVIPGGIDPHVHLNLETSNGFTADDFASGSEAALAGGTTTLLDFVTPSRNQKMMDALSNRLQDAEQCKCDYSFHVSPVQLDKETERSIEKSIDKGFTSFKLYMAYLESIGLDDQALLKIMTIVSKNNGLVLVHCESGKKIGQLRKELIAQGKTDPKYHPLSRPAKFEAEAVNKIIHFSEQSGCPVYIVHVSTKESIELITKAKQRGLKIYAETCPHYLLLDEGLYNAPFKNSAKHICSPPYRSKTDQNALWEALEENIFDTIGTDHCQFWYRQKEEGLHDFTKIANGIGSIEYRLGLMYTYGVLQNRITENQWVSILSTNPSKIFQLESKGCINVGYDADVVIWDPDFDSRISQKTQHQNGDMNVYEGFALKGAPKHVIKGGQIVVQNRTLMNPDKGKLLFRERRLSKD